MIDLKKKYAPRRYGDFVQGINTRPIEDLVLQERVGMYQPVVLGHGGVGLGKTAAARTRMARRNCWRWQEHPYEPCGTCTGCKSAFNGGGGHNDAVCEFDASSSSWRNRLEKHVRERRSIRLCPKVNPDLPQVCFVDEFHRASVADQNAILKLTEDSGFSFFLATSLDARVDAAILSRSLRLTFSPPDRKEAERWLSKIVLQEQLTIEHSALGLLIDCCDRQPRQVLTYLQECAIRGSHITVDIVRRVAPRPSSAAGNMKQSEILRSLA